MSGIFKALTSGGKVVTKELTEESLLARIDILDKDLTAGHGTLSKQDLLVDLIMRDWRICMAQVKGIPLQAAKPILGKQPTQRLDVKVVDPIDGVLDLRVPKP